MKYYGIGVVKSFCFVLSFVHTTLLANIEDDLTALAFFQQAQVSFDEHHISKAKNLLKQALSFKRFDGVVVEKPKLYFKKSFVGRARKPLVNLQGEKVSYTPNKLLSLIKKEEATLYALTKKMNKRKSPPLLLINQFIIDDEDNNNLVSPYETISITFNVANIGEATAEEVEIQLSLRNDPSFKETFKLGNLTINQTKEVNHVFQLPKSKILGNKIELEIESFESDGLGEVSKLVTLETKKYFIPVLQFTPINNTARALSHKRDTKLCYLIKNVGSETAYDLKFSLDFDFSDTLKVIKDIDLKNIYRLLEEEERTFCFSLSTSKNTNKKANLGAYISYQFRAGEPIRYPLELYIGNANSHNAYAANIYEAKAMQVSPIKIGSTPNKSIALVLNNKRSNSVLQAENMPVMRRVFESNLGIDPRYIFPKQHSTLTNWGKYFDKSNVRPALEQIIKKNKIKTLHIYLVSDGVFEHVSQTAYLIMNNYQGRHQLELNAWLSSLSSLSVEQINIYLETEFTSTETVHFPIFSHIPLVINSPKKINIMSAAIAKQPTKDFNQQRQGIFTYFLAAGLGGKADSNNDQSVDSEELSFYLRKNILEASQAIHEKKQYPWVLVNQNKTLVNF